MGPGQGDNGDIQGCILIIEGKPHRNLAPIPNVCQNYPLPTFSTDIKYKALFWEPFGSCFKYIYWFPQNGGWNCSRETNVGNLLSQLAKYFYIFYLWAFVRHFESTFDNETFQFMCIVFSLNQRGLYDIAWIKFARYNTPAWIKCTRYDTPDKMYHI